MQQHAFLSSLQLALEKIGVCVADRFALHQAAQLQEQDATSLPCRGFAG